jgi:tRNA-specific 2-thiouridylase
MPKVIVGMSGGVDSSVTAYLLKEQGFEVEGISFILWEARNRSSFTTCCSLESTLGALKTAESVGISHSSIDVREAFIEKVIEPFVDSYAKGITPNPCILCNRHIKFPFLLEEADKRGAHFIATGHYARVNDALLLKGVDPGKDQSYVLYILTPAALKRLVLPLGEYRKKDVRELARSLHLDAADRPESQEICFVEDRNYFKFVEKLLPASGEPGPIMDAKGKVLGMHKGLYRYTIGQRKGLGIASPSPYYVTRIDSLKNIIHVGTREGAQIREIFVDSINWILPAPSSSFRATVKVRSMMEDRPAFIELCDGSVRVIFDEPQWAPAPGQSAVFYEGDTVIGGGVIESCIYPGGRPSPLTS